MLKIQKVIRSKKKSGLRIKALQRFFKTGPGEYGEGDIFLGISVPESREIAKSHGDLSLEEIEILLTSQFHEERLIALLILVNQFPKETLEGQKRLYQFYVRHSKQVNGWDLVDTSAEHIVGRYLFKRKRDKLHQFAKSKNVWQRRIAIMSTFHFIKNNEHEETLRLAKVLLHDDHDLIQKAVGWMLREVGKRVDKKALTNFLDKHAQEMPRTMLRYAVERLPITERRRYMLKF